MRSPSAPLGESAARQPVHTGLWRSPALQGRHPQRLGELALRSMEIYGRHALEFAYGVGFVPKTQHRSQPPVCVAGVLRGVTRPAAWRVPQRLARLHGHERVLRKLEREAVEESSHRLRRWLRGHGRMPERIGRQKAAFEVALGMRQGTLPPFLGIRIKSLSGVEERKVRGARTLEIFLENPAGADRWTATLRTSWQ